MGFSQNEPLFSGSSNTQVSHKQNGSLSSLSEVSTSSAEAASSRLYDDVRDLLRMSPPLITTMLFLSIVCMNLLANKSINTGLDWLALDCGILFSWMTFMSMDVLTKCFGPRATTTLSMVAIGVNLVVACIFFVASLIPGEWSASYVEGSETAINLALDSTFRGTWFIILGSSIAFAVSAIVNNYLNAAIGKLLSSKHGFGEFAARAYISTATAQFIDNLVFALLVSKTFFGWSLIQCFTCALTGAVLELLFEVVFSPLGYHITQGILAERKQNIGLQHS